jgi:hypothetical protein
LILNRFLLTCIYEIEEDTYGHVSIASGGVTPLITPHTASLVSTGSSPSATVEKGLGCGKLATYYLNLWAKVLKRRGNFYVLKIDPTSNKVGSAVLWFPITNATNVRNWYINFRLCGDNFSNFIAHQQLQHFEDVTEVSTPPSELDCVVSMLSIVT